MPPSRLSRLPLAIGLLCAGLPLLAAPLQLDGAGRTRQDKDRDTYNRPAELLAFWGIREGMKVMDLYPGDGYTTLLLSQIVGPAGKVLAFGSYDHDGFDKRMKPLGLANVEETIAKEPESFKTLPADLAKLPAGSLDAIITIRNYHDIESPAEALAELKRLLKPGGVLGVADSRTSAGRDKPNHRIADDVIIREVTAAGFTLAGTSQMLANPRDDYAKGFWEERFIVDQSCLKFTK
jgi:predicted methyltransferase